jgi:multiple sugar transport system substrate-binding protein
VGQKLSRKIATAASLAGVTALIATGCATAGSGAGDANTLTLWTHNGGNKEELAIVKEIVKDYNASQKKVTIQVKAFPQESYNSAVTAAATSKKLPCILDTDAPNVPSWAHSGFLAPLDLPKEVVDKNIDSTKGVYQEKLYSIGYYDAALAIFAHQDALTKAGVRIPTVKDPWTGDEFNTALEKIKAGGGYDHAFDLGTGEPATEWWTYAYSPFLESFGGDLIDRDGYKTADGVLNGDGAKKWAAWFRGLVTKGYAPAKSSSDAFADWQNGKSAMVWTGIWNAGELAKVKDGVAIPPPDFGNGPKIGGGSWQWAVSSSCTNKAAAMDYLKFSLDPKYLAEFANKQSVVPATEEAAALAGNGWEEGGVKRFFLDESSAFAELRPVTPGYPYLTSTFAKAAQDIIAGGDTGKVLDKAVSDIDADLKSNDYYGN